ncbi:TetR family transcriptional regulator [Swingsia samuiensis]|uniref:TetR family transcriptional regulator n=2 Tax=Swingsia samuiensis TaxID=1293412 RepID=A0A4Y6ULR1_9PROT|nr:TetR family transcriptional regulator [Swingsia samuiensis]
MNENNVFSEDTADLDKDAFDIALLQAAMNLASLEGWHHFSMVEAAKEAGLPIDAVRSRYPLKSLLLLRLGKMADESALRDEGQGSSLREHLFDLIMRRFDLFQEYREGIRSVLHTLPRDPALTAFLAGATLDSMRWIADAAGIDCSGLGGICRINGLAAIWGTALRAWEKDESQDLGITMAALEKSLEKAERYGVLKPSSRRKMQDAISHTGTPNHNLELES